MPEKTLSLSNTGVSQMGSRQQELNTADLALRASLPHSALPRPFLRWAGSKRLLLSQLVNALPRRFRDYREPFLGGGSLFFLLQPDRAVLGDKCAPLIDAYAAVRDDVSKVLSHIAPLKPDRDLYYRIRQTPASGRFRRAAEFIYLNKTCWNGLYRVNSSGQFNVPYGRPKTDTIIDPINLRACSTVLLKPGVRLVTGDFEQFVDLARRGDLVYLDPPYVTGHNNNGFRDYNETLFSWADQERLAEFADRLAARGAHVVVSNAHHPAVLRLYRGFDRQLLTRKATLAGDVAKRGTASEAVYYRHAK